MPNTFRFLQTSAAAAAIAAFTIACGRAEAPSDSVAVDTTAAQAGEAMAVPAVPPGTELTLFAPLPDRMTAGTVAPTEAQIALGRALYHETRLSANHDVSCNSCHPLNAYGVDGRSRSFGDRGQPGGRNAPTVYNAAGHVAQFWDGRAPTVEEQAKGPILNPDEMAMADSQAVLAHLRSSPEYVAAFRAAFPGQPNPVTYENVGRAIGAFERGLVTPSRWDRFLAGDSAALTATEQRGLRTFVAVGCAACHNGAYVGGQSFQKVGLTSPWPAPSDSGRYQVTGQPSDVHVFKVAALRNVGRTAPYFHDGSVATLPDAIQLMAHHQLGRQLTPADVRDIAAWLAALTGELPLSYIAFPQQPADGR